MFAEFSQPASDAPARPLWRVRDMFYGIALLVATIVLISLTFIAYGVDPDGDERPTFFGLTTITFQLLLIASVVWLAYRRGLRPADLGLTVRPRLGTALTAWLGAYAIIIGYGVLLLLLESAGVNVSAFEASNDIPVDIRESAFVLVLFAVGVVALGPVAEELFFRALLFRGMRGYWRLRTSLLVSGLAFGLFHINLGVLLPFAAIGALFAWANERNGSLWTPIAAHAGINTVSFLLSITAES